MENTEEKLKRLIDDLKPYLNMDGGNIEYIKYEDNILYVKLYGNCVNCLMQDDTLNNGILNMLKEEVPEIKEIINVQL